MCLLSGAKSGEQKGPRRAPGKSALLLFVRLFFEFIHIKAFEHKMCALDSAKPDTYLRGVGRGAELPKAMNVVLARRVATLKVKGRKAGFPAHGWPPSLLLKEFQLDGGAFSCPRVQLYLVRPLTLGRDWGAQLNIRRGAALAGAEFGSVGKHFDFACAFWPGNCAVVWFGWGPLENGLLFLNGFIEHGKANAALFKKHTPVWRVAREPGKFL